MIRVILSTGAVIRYESATHATPGQEDGITCVNIHDGKTQFACITGPCVCDDGAGYISTAQEENMRYVLNQQKCRQCGCTHFNPCVQGNDTCSWIEPDLCSFCAETPITKAAKKLKKKK